MVALRQAAVSRLLPPETARALSLAVMNDDDDRTACECYSHKKHVALATSLVLSPVPVACYWYMDPPSYKQGRYNNS